MYTKKFAYNNPAFTNNHPVEDFINLDLNVQTLSPHSHGIIITGTRLKSLLTDLVWQMGNIDMPVRYNACYSENLSFLLVEHLEKCLDYSKFYKVTIKDNEIKATSIKKDPVVFNPLESYTKSLKYFFKLLFATVDNEVIYNIEDYARFDQDEVLELIDKIFVIHQGLESAIEDFAKFIIEDYLLDTEQLTFLGYNLSINPVQLIEPVKKYLTPYLPK